MKKKKTEYRAVNEFEFDAGTVRTVPSFFNACDETSGAASAYTPQTEGRRQKTNSEDRRQNTEVRRQRAERI